MAGHYRVRPMLQHSSQALLGSVCQHQCLRDNQELHSLQMSSNHSPILADVVECTADGADGCVLARDWCQSSVLRHVDSVN